MLYVKYALLRLSIARYKLNYAFIPTEQILSKRIHINGAKPSCTLALMIDTMYVYEYFWSWTPGAYYNCPHCTSILW